jgi:hypothetical protein
MLLDSIRGGRCRVWVNWGGTFRRPRHLTNPKNGRPSRGLKLKNKNFYFERGYTCMILGKHGGKNKGKRGRGIGKKGNEKGVGYSLT